MLANDPAENADSADPTEPMDSTEPTDPIDSTEPLLPIDRIEFSDRKDQRDEDMTAWCHPHGSDVRSRVRFRILGVGSRRRGLGRRLRADRDRAGPG